MGSKNRSIPIIPMDPSMKLIHHFLEVNAARLPEKVALVHGPVRASYDEINSRANSLAHYFTSTGVRRGDRVALLMENSVEYVVAYYGIMKAGAVAVPLNSDLKPEGLRNAIDDLETRVLISSSRFEKIIQVSNLGELGPSEVIMKSPRSYRPSSGQTLTVFDSVTAARSLSNPDLPIGEGDLSSIIYTSGSTGGPKGVMLTHRNIVDNTFSICQYLRLTENDIQMCVLPFFYVMGKSLLNTHFAVGGTLVINNQFAFSAVLLKEMIAENVTGFSGVPSTFAYLLHRSPLAASRDKLTSLRYVSQAGGHMARAIKEKLRRVLPPHTEIVIMYGATEGAARLSHLEPQKFLEKIESIGKAIPGVTLKIMKEDGSEAAVGEVGELVASGSNIMQGYWKNPKATAEVLVNGWYHTGDLVYQDQEGFYFVVGRKDGLLKVGGHKLNPQEIEDMLLESGMLVEAVVLGLPDGLLGNRLVVLAVPTEGVCASQTVMAFCAQRLSKFKMPSEVRFSKVLPKNASGKIDRQDCLALFSSLPPTGLTAAPTLDQRSYAQPSDKD